MPAARSASPGCATRRSRRSISQHRPTMTCTRCSGSVPAATAVISRPRSTSPRGDGGAAGVRTVEGWDDIAAYWRVLETNLGSRHGATPTHSLAEIEYLHDRFPQEIVLVTARIGDDLAAGNLFFAEGPVLYQRYTATTDEGRTMSASDLVIEQGIALASERGCRFYSFGTSTLDEGRQLNEPQYDYKISFGAGGVAHDHYELDLRS